MAESLNQEPTKNCLAKGGKYCSYVERRAKNIGLIEAKEE